MANRCFKIIENVDWLIVSYLYTTNLTLVHGYSGQVLILFLRLKSTRHCHCFGLVIRPKQVKCTCNTNVSTYTIYALSSK